ncbi:PQQ-dependent sugar dehydrogenase [Variovorax sp. YR752]|uniref:PQQ-dependent sugar dehydrogenase n=1 Tax=Variovorax sp. YR752 TaxID=1884383 RepID=UPI003138047F
MHRLIAFLLAALTWVAAQAQAPTLKTVPVATGLDRPWALAFLPDGRMLVTEKPGQMRVIAADGRVGPALGGLPPVDATGQCGLLDVAVDPGFARNGLVYWTFAEPGDGGNSTAVARGRLDGDRLLEVRTIFSQKPKVASRLHCGSRIVFGRDGTLWVGLGDRYSRKDDAQNPANHIGKVVRIDRDGRAPADNPKFAAAEVWSLGHRNIQGAAAHPATGVLWTVEHGPQGGDEVNAPRRGANHGWPLVTRGRNYVTGTRIGEDGPKPGFEEPLKVWVPSIAPSGMAFLSSDRYPGWQGSLFVGALKAQLLVRLTLDGGKVVAEERLLQDLGERIRDVRQGPDGWLYLVTDGRNGQVLRLER